MTRLRAAWGALGSDQRLAAIAAFALFATMFLPWYQKNFSTPRGETRDANLTALAAFSWVEGAVLLVAAGVLTLLFARAERKPFHLPGGDGTVIMAAGVWAALLIFYRFFDQPKEAAPITIGIQWGIFFALGAAIVLAVAGSRVRAAHRPEPPLPQAAEPEPQAEPSPPGAYRVSDDRPHLDETAVMSRGDTATQRMPSEDETRRLPRRPKPPPGHQKPLFDPEVRALDVGEPRAFDPRHPGGDDDEPPTQSSNSAQP